MKTIALNALRRLSRYIDATQYPAQKTHYKDLYLRIYIRFIER